MWVHASTRPRPFVRFVPEASSYIPLVHPRILLYEFLLVMGIVKWSIRNSNFFVKTGINYRLKNDAVICDFRFKHIQQFSNFIIQLLVQTNYIFAHRCTFVGHQIGATENNKCKNIWPKNQYISHISPIFKRKRTHQYFLYLKLDFNNKHNNNLRNITLYCIKKCRRTRESKFHSHYSFRSEFSFLTRF